MKQITIKGVSVYFSPMQNAFYWDSLGMEKINTDFFTESELDYLLSIINN